MIPVLLTPAQAAERLGLPAESLLREAAKHGHLVMVGRAKRIPESELGELIEKCRCQPKVPASTFENAKDNPVSGSSLTATKQGGASRSAHALTIANKLKSNSLTTSRGKTAEVVPLSRGK